jgi:hypothetical protein
MPSHRVITIIKGLHLGTSEVAKTYRVIRTDKRPVLASKAAAMNKTHTPLFLSNY